MSNKKLARNIGVMSFAVFISRILGLIRDQVMAFYFGTTYLNDAFNVAYNLPNLIRRLFGEGALSAAFVPIYNEIGIKHDRKAQFDFAINVLSILTLFLAILTFLGIVFAPILVKLLYPGLSIQTSLLAVKLSRIVFPYLFLIGMSSTLIAILNSHDYFFMTGLSSAMLNLGMIAAVAIPATVMNVKGEDLVIWAGWGVIFGGVFQTLVNFPYLRKIGYSFRIILRFSGDAIYNLWNRFVPAMLGIGIREINLLADALMASFLPVGSITALSFGNRLMQLPLGIFGIATGTAVLPHYSKHITEKNWPALSESLRFTTITLTCLMLPVTLIIFGLGDDFVRILFKRGAFGDRATLMTSQALFYYSMGLIFFSLNQTITPLFYANKDTRTPVIIAAWMVGLNIILNFILMQFIQHRGLALATSITGMVNYLLLLLLIRKTMPDITFSGIKSDIGKIILISILVFIPFYMACRSFIFPGLFQTIVKSIILAALYFILFYILTTVFKIRYIRTLYINIWHKLIKR
jgi:putative peptidoglycan lipid II flippase